MARALLRAASALVPTLSPVGIRVSRSVYPNGRLARLYDPEVNPIEFLEPAGRDASNGG